MAKILIVDDDALGAQIYLNQLTALGHEVTLATDGEMAMAKLNQRHDLILLDIMVPRIGGVELLSYIKKSVNAATAVLVYTNLISEETKEKCMMLGAKEYLLKADLTPSQLVDKISSYLSA